MRQQIAEIAWEFNRYGPYVHDEADLTARDLLFIRLQIKNAFGQWKEIIQLVTDCYQPRVSNTERMILDHVIDKTKFKSWDEFIRLIYSTYPIRAQPGFSKLDLVGFGQKE